jgi:Ser/Thr protein kinase RdoA (MazF antagonist)
MTTEPKLALLRHWKIDAVTAWQALQENVWHITLADGRNLVFKAIGAYTETIAQRLDFERDVLNHVVERGVAAAVPMLSTVGTPYVIDDGQIYRLSQWLVNRFTAPQTDAERMLLYRNYGTAIARFHAALATYQDDRLLERTWASALSTRVFAEALPTILAHLTGDRLAQMQATLAELEPAMRIAYADLPRQLVIWDCHPGNVAVDGLTVSGFIDCDHLAVAPRVLDLADFLVHLMKWDLQDEAKLATWLAHVPHLLAAYEAVTPLSDHERHALYYAMLAEPLIFMDFFFQGGRPELTATEYSLFLWLAQQRGEITAQLATACYD